MIKKYLCLVFLCVNTMGNGLGPKKETAFQIGGCAVLGYALGKCFEILFPATPSGTIPIYHKLSYGGMRCTIPLLPCLGAILVPVAFIAGRCSHGT